MSRKKYYVDYYDKDDDLQHFWCYASCKEDAEEKCKSENWDVLEILQVREVTE